MRSHNNAEHLEDGAQYNSTYRFVTDRAWLIICNNGKQ